jgi:hypothetical protein
VRARARPSPLGKDGYKRLKVFIRRHGIGVRRLKETGTF